MSRATQEATVERPYSESEREGLGSQVAELYARLLAVMKEEAELRISLKTLLDREEAEIMEAYYEAEQNITLFRAKREKIQRETKRDRTPSLQSLQEPEPCTGQILIAGDLGNIVASPTPLHDEPATFLPNEGFTSQQSMPDKRPSAEREGLSGYPNFLKPYSESFFATYRGKKRSEGWLLRNGKKPLALSLIKDLKRSKQNTSIWRKEVQEMTRIAGKWEAQGSSWAEQGKFKKQEVAKAQKLILLEEMEERIDWIVAEEIRMHPWKIALRQFSLIESEAGTRSTSRPESDEPVGSLPIPSKADTLDNEVF